MIGSWNNKSQKFPKYPVAPYGLEKLLEYVKVKYENPAVMIHENGLASSDDNWSDPLALNDTERIEYLQSYIQSMHTSIRNGSNTRGYFIWSFMDCFEFGGGYTVRFGLYAVDFNDTNLKRYPRMSAQWYSSFLASKSEESRDIFLHLSSE